MIRGMKLATLLLFTVALLAGPTPQAQNQNLIGPGEVLVVKLCRWAANCTSPASPTLAMIEIVAVTRDGKLSLPLLSGVKSSEDISVAGLDLGQAAERLEAEGKKSKSDYRHVVVERGTVDQLLRQ
jgi:protein involved in polysaccharide export with SLBB domain